MRSGGREFPDDGRREKRAMGAQPIDYKNDGRRNESRRTRPTSGNQTLMERALPKKADGV